MIVFGVDMPLVEILFALAILNIIILVEVIVVVILLMRNLKKTKER